MSYQQAYHTSCRLGLGVQPGFQFNAASGGLTPSVLADLASAHAGYQTPPGSPPEPTEAELAGFPVSLKFAPVDGVGPVLSRTSYVGREFRGRDGESDTGRYGNYFSHIVVGDGDERPFGRLLPIELWDAPHWTIAESAGTELAPLGRLEAGPVDLETSLRHLAAERAAWLAPVAGASLAAACGGPRVVVVEAEERLRPAWVAWVTLSLPPDRARELTFNTYSGAPVRASDVMLCVTDPTCDVSFPAYELGNTVQVIDTGAEAEHAVLYGWVIAAVAMDEPSTAREVVSALPAGLNVARAASTLVASTGRVELVEEADVDAFLTYLISAVGRDPVERLADLADRIRVPAHGSSVQLWAELYGAARADASSTDPALVDVALKHLVPVLGDLDDGAAPDGPPAGPEPGVGALAGWVKLTDGADRKQLDRLLRGAVTLRLVGINAVLDERVGRFLGDSYEDESRRGLVDRLVELGGQSVATSLGQRILERYAAGELGVELLNRVAAIPAARTAMERKAADEDSFALRAAWETVCVQEDPSRRPRAIANLAAVAEGEADLDLIRGLFGASGPVSADEYAELLSGIVAAGAKPPRGMVDSALECLAGYSRGQRREVAALFRVLKSDQVREHASRDAAYGFWWLQAQASDMSFDRWSEYVARFATPVRDRLPKERLREMLEIAGTTAIRKLQEPAFAPGYEQLARSYGEAWPRVVSEHLREALKGAVNPEALAADAFLALQAVRVGDAPAEVLPDVLGVLDSKAMELVPSFMRRGDAEAWQRLLEEHPPRRGVGRAMRRVLGRRGKP